MLFLVDPNSGHPENLSIKIKNYSKDKKNLHFYEKIVISCCFDISVKDVPIVLNRIKYNIVFKFSNSSPQDYKFSLR